MTNLPPPVPGAGSPGPAETAAIVVAAVFSRPFSELVPAGLVAQLFRSVTLKVLESPPARAQLVSLLVAARAALVQALPGQRRLGDQLPRELSDGLRALVRRPLVVERGLLQKALAQEPVRRLTRELMVGTLLDYGRKLRTAVLEPPKKTEDGKSSLGSFGRLASGAMRVGTGALGAIAGAVVPTAVSDEIEQKLQRKTLELADGAVSDLNQRIIQLLTDPGRGAEQAALRLSFLDMLFDLTGAELARELAKLEVEPTVDLAWSAATAWLQRPESEAELLALVTRLLGLEAGDPQAAGGRRSLGSQSLSTVLAALGIDETLRTVAVERLASALAACS